MNGESAAARLSTTSAALGLALAGLYTGSNPDTFGHLAQGRQIAELGYVPQVDRWSLLPGPPRPWHNYEWLSDLGTYLLYDGLGYEAITLFKCALLAITAWCLTTYARTLGGARAELLSGLAILSTIPAIRSRLSDRPHVLGICLAAAYVLLLTRLQTKAADRKTRAALVACVTVLHLLWVNAHGSHLLGLAITGSFAVFASSGARALLFATLGLQLLASCVSPYGPAIVIDAIDHIVDARYRGLITEWLPWRTTDPPWLQLGPALQGALLTLAAPLLLRTHVSARSMLPVAALLGIASFRSIRFVAEFMLLSAPLVAIAGASLSERLTQRRFAWLAGALALALVPMVVAGAAVLPPRVGIGLGMSFSELPIASGRLLARHGRTPHVLAAMQDSWFTMFAAPNARLVIDGRVPFYGPEHVTRISEAFASRPHFDRIVATFGVNVVIANHAAVEERALTSFASAGGFALVLIEDMHALYVREGALDPEGTALFPPLRALEPNYELTWLLEANARRITRMHQELARLAKIEGTSAYRGWIEGVLTLAPMRRGGASDGFRWPRDGADWDAYRRALPLIGRAAKAAPHVPVVAALHGEVAAVLCEFEIAERAIARALAQETSREPLLVAQELALRRGELEQARSVIERARATPQGQHDPWLAELATGLTSPPRCPPKDEP